MKPGDLVKVSIFDEGAPLLEPTAWPPPDVFVGIYIKPDHEYHNNHLVMFDGGVWTTPGYQIEVLNETR